MLCLDGDGSVTAANTTASTMLAGLQRSQGETVHANDLFGLSLPGLV